MKKILPDKAILIPDNAKKVFTGQIFDVYQWPQALYDGSEATFEMLKRPDTVQVIAIKDGKLVLIQNNQPGRVDRITFVGGRADEDGSWLEAAKRETLEEVGMEFASWRLIYVEQPIPKIEWFVPWFLAADLTQKQPQKLDAGEKIEVKLTDFDEVSKLVIESNDSTLKYAVPVFRQVSSLQELIDLPEFKGQEVDR